MSAYPNSKVHLFYFFITSDFKGYVLWEFHNSRKLWECSSLSIVGCDLSHFCSDGWVSFLWQFLDGSAQFMVVDPMAMRRQSCSQGQRMYALPLSLSLSLTHYAWDWSPGRCVLCCCRNRKPWDVETLVLTIVFEVIWRKKVQVWTMCWTLASKDVPPQGDAYWNLKEKEVTKHNATVPGLVMSLSSLWNLHACWQKSFRAENGMVQLSNHVMFLTSEQKIECCSFQTISLFLTSERTLLLLTTSWLDLWI